MIRRSNLYRRLWYYNRRRANSLHIYSKLFLIVFLVSVLAMYVNSRLSPYMVEISEIKVKTAVVEAISKTVSEELGGKIKYNDLAIIGRDSKNRVTSIEVNTVKLNELTASITGQLQKRLSAIEEERIAVPVGALTGIPIFSAEGPDLYIKTIPIGDVMVEFVSDFSKAGENQTRHRIYLEVETRMGLAVPLVKKETTIVTSIPVAETIIVGQIPEPYISAWKSMNN